MKTKILFFAMLLSAVVSNAQYTKLFDFNGTNGEQPYGSVILSANDSVLYGMTNGGGPTNGGNIFSVNTDGTGYMNIHNFMQGDSANGIDPYGSLIRSGNVLYGMTDYSGQSGNGTIFSIHTDGSGFTILHNFISAGGNPMGTLTISGNVLYGMTYGTGGSSMGNVFSIHTDGGAYTDLLEFSGTNGEKPGYGALALSGNILYGTTMYGGANGIGVIFSIHTNGTGYYKILDFNTTNGNMPYSSPIISGNVLYGVCGGGAYGKGVIYSIHTDGTGYTKLLDLNGTNGQGPMGTLTLSGNLLYGTTGSGGANNGGTIFSIDTSGSNFHSLYSFNTPTGTQPRAQLSLSGNVLYGTCVTGGTYNEGVVFSLKTQPAALPICMVTVDDSSKYNHIIWDKPISTSIDSFIVYREITSNNYKQIGAVPYTAISEFMDTAKTMFFPFTGDPNAGTYRYKLQYRNTDGAYSQLSPYHNTLFVTQSGGTFNWNPYTIEGDSVPLPALTAYVLYRDDNSNGNWHAIQGVSGTQTTVTDPDYAAYPNGSWRVETTWNISCTPTAKTETTYSTSKSNVKISTVNGIENLLFNESVYVFPNPTTGEFTISLNQPTNVKGTLEITNTLGEVIKHIELAAGQNTYNINLSKAAAGVYFVKLQTGSGNAVKKIMVKY